jgi:hypothetical protein
MLERFPYSGPVPETTLQRMLPFYEEFTREQSSDPSGRHQRGRAYHRLGVIRQQLNQLPEADAAYVQAIALLEQLAADFPREPNYRFDLASSMLNRADLLRQTGRSGDAEQLSGKARQILEALVKAFPQVRDYRLYIRFQPTPAGLFLTGQLTAVRNEPPLVEVWSGKALNDLLGGIVPLLEKGESGLRIPLAQDVLDHLNLTTGERRSTGLLRNGGRLDWPVALREAKFQKECQSVEKLFPKAVEEAATSGRVPPASIELLKANLGQLQTTLADRIIDFSPAQYIESKRYLNTLGDAVVVLASPDAASYFNLKYRPRDLTVEGLVQHMITNGLRFAPATPGDEAAYLALHGALAAYKADLAQRSKK